ncbi:MAG: ATP-grasp domain-containing protein [Bacillota bacterium]
MRLQILGGGSGQLSAIKKAKSLGHEVVVCDYLEEAPGKKIADFAELVSTFDIKRNIEVAKKYKVDGIFTVGTDQPVYTAAQVASKLNLPTHLKLKTAKEVTNKRDMKRKFTKANIPTVKYEIIDKNFFYDIFEDFKFPVVVKPLDSQGQRGIFKLNSVKEIRNHFEEVITYSREEKILVEEYYESEEITVSGWVHENELTILTITDRVTHENKNHIGICSAHIFPSKFLKEYHNEIRNISEKIVSSFSINNGPIYFQMLIGKDGVKVNEIASRIGGAYEGDFMPNLTGVDILKMMINLSLGKKIDYQSLKNYKLANNEKWLSVQLFFARPGIINKITPAEKIKKLKGVSQIAYNFDVGDKINEIENATERAGYYIVKASSKNQLKKRIADVFNNLKILNDRGENLVIREIGEVL